MARIARFFRTAVVGWVVLFAACCFAGESATANGTPRWACWYAPGIEEIHCLLVRAPEGGYTVDAVTAERARQLHLPEVVRAIWSDPNQISGYRVRIPMWTPPFEMAFAHQLADSVMCGSRTECRVIFDANDDGRGPLRAAALEAGVPESEVARELAAQGITLAPVAATTLAADEPPRRIRKRRRSFSDVAS